MKIKICLSFIGVCLAARVAQSVVMSVSQSVSCQFSQLVLKCQKWQVNLE